MIGVVIHGPRAAFLAGLVSGVAATCTALSLTAATLAAALIALPNP